MKNVFFFLSIVGIFYLSLECNQDTPPRFRVRNDRATKANVQIKTSDGNTININGVDTGVISDFQSTASGRIDVSAGIQGETVVPTLTFNATNNSSYTIVVATGNPPTLRLE